MLNEIITAITISAAPAVAATELIKRTLKIKGVGAVVVSVICSYGAALQVLERGTVEFVLIGLGIALSINGVFKAFHKS